MFKKYSGLISIGLVLLLLLLSSIQSTRDLIGRAADIVLGPLVSTGLPFYMIIIVLSVITGLYTTLIQKYAVDSEHLQEVQSRAMAFQKEYREAQLSKDERKLKSLEQKRLKVMQEQLESSKEQFKPMGYMFIVTIPILLWMAYKIPTLTSGVEIIFPYLGTFNLYTSSIWIFPAWIFWYIICSFAISQVIRKSMNLGGP